MPKNPRVFGKHLTLVAIQAFNGTSHGQMACEQCLREWKKDPSVLVRQFHRTVRAGGASCQVTVVVVRRKHIEDRIQVAAS